MAALLEPLARSGGRCVLISSSYVRSVPREWPQYVTAKAAAEGLVNWAAARYPQVPFLVARPPRLLTDQTNTPSGRQGALGVEVAAATIIRQVAGPATGGVELLEAF
jgi:NAD(P)-dependent dehydrogenase (short-subunit alcohol dehydrogenase family)